jgi:hypothetical protein
MPLYCYRLCPIDFWFGALSSKQLLEMMAGNKHSNWATASSLCRELGELQSSAQAVFKQIGWEGDIRESPYYFSVPGDNKMEIGYIIKQDNNGDCFVASPVPLPHLKQLDYATVDLP